MEIFFGSAMRQKLLSHLFNNPDISYHVRELATLLQVDPGNLSKELAKLERRGLCKSNKHGKYKVFSINKEHEIYSEFLRTTDNKNIQWRSGVPSIIHGQAIIADQIEGICSYWNPLQFTALCNNVIWATIFNSINAIPKLSERVIVSDDGIDAEFMGDVSTSSLKSSNPFIKTGYNVFQFKKRDIRTRSRAEILSNLNSNLKGAIQHIYTETGQSVNNYVLFTNVSLATGDHDKLEKNLLAGYSGTKPSINIVGASELATLINNVPHIRSAFFVSSGFSSWEKSYEKSKNASMYGVWTELIGRDEDLTSLKAIIDNKQVKIVIIRGPQGIGKTRLVIEATCHRRWDTVVVDDPKYFSSTDISALESPSREALIILDDPDPEQIKSLSGEALAKNTLKVIITLPIADESILPRFGYDERAVLVSVGSLSREKSEELIKASGARMDYSLLSWIVYNAGGNPGILLAASSASKDLRSDCINFVETIGRSFEQRVKDTLGNNAITALRLISLLEYVGIYGEHRHEIELIIRALGDSFTLTNLLNEINGLEQAGLIIRKGAFFAISSPLFATYLAQQLLRGKEDAILILFSQLPDTARTRFLKRLGRLSPDTIQQFWNTIFSPDGLFGNLKAIQKNIRIMHILAGAVPLKIIEVLEREISPLPVAERSKIEGDFRRELMWALEQLLFRQSTSLQALRLVGLLAEAENETWGNNATGVFCECYHALHSQMPLCLRDRVTLLEEFSNINNSTALRLLVVKAINKGLTRHGSHSLRESDGIEPFEGMPHMTYGEIWSYLNELGTILIKLAEDKNEEISKEACKVLPHAISELVIQGLPEQGAEKMKYIYSKSSGSLQINVTDFSRALNLAIEVLSDRVAKDKLSAEAKKSHETALAVLTKIRELLDKGAFAIKLKRWTGGWAREPEEIFQKEIKALAKHAVDNPEDLTDTLLEWLLGGDAQRAFAFFISLGELDITAKWLPKIEDFAKTEPGAHSFGCYCAGLTVHSYEKISKRVGELYTTKKIHSHALLYAIASLDKGSSESVDRVTCLIKDQLIDPEFAERLLVCGKWTETLSDDDYLRLLQAIAGTDFQHSTAVIDMLSMWIHMKKPIKGKLADFAWQCLEAPMTGSNRNDAWDYDQVACLLARDNPDKGFSLAKTLLSFNNEKYWDPIDRFGARTFWALLSEHNSRKALELLLEVSTISPSHHQSISWNLQEILDQVRDKELIIEFSLKNQEWAAMLTEGLSSNKSGFWEVAIPIIEKYLSDRRIMSHIGSGIEQLGFTIVGEYSNHLQKCSEEVEKALRMPDLPSKVRLWLQKLLSKQKEEIKLNKTQEAHEKVEGYACYRQSISSDNKELREWAISKALQRDGWRECIKHATKADVLAVLSKYTIDEGRKSEILGALG